jgi:hypothetical protein
MAKPSRAECAPSIQDFDVIATSPSEFLAAYADMAPLPHAEATARGAYLVSPADFTLERNRPATTGTWTWQSPSTETRR